MNVVTHDELKEVLQDLSENFKSRALWWREQRDHIDGRIAYAFEEMAEAVEQTIEEKLS